MPVPRRASAPICALVAGAAIITPIAFNAPAQAGPKQPVKARSAEASAQGTSTESARAAKKGFHSRKGAKKCGRGKTVWIGTEAFGRARVSWKPSGGKLVSRQWPYDPRALQTRYIPTWRKHVKWKVTSTMGPMANPKKLTKAFAYCSKTGWRGGLKSQKVNQRKAGVKRCPAGKTVMITSGGIGNIWHKFKSTRRGSKVHTQNFGDSQGYIASVRMTPTEMRSVKWVVQARNNERVRPARTGRVEIDCISKY
ncbi:hypothetical protein ACQB60_18855 [Actinomycetota bacterium Odt1-20B]